eukprot:1563155-Amphidinium_carterae.1
MNRTSKPTSEKYLKRSTGPIVTDRKRQTMGMPQSCFLLFCELFCSYCLCRFWSNGALALVAPLFETFMRFVAHGPSTPVLETRLKENQRVSMNTWERTSGTLQLQLANALQLLTLPQKGVGMSSVLGCVVLRSAATTRIAVSVGH